MAQLAPRPRSVVAGLMGQFHSDPESYLALMAREVPDYEVLQDETAAATRGVYARAILELGTGTGETTRRVLREHPGARLHGIDSSPEMLDVARDALASFDVELSLRAIEDPLPPGPFDLVVSALAIHHLDDTGKQALFTRIAGVLRRGGRFVFADVVVPEEPADAVTPIDEAYDLPDSVADQLSWLERAGLTGRVRWTHRDLAVLVADRA